MVMKSQRTRTPFSAVPVFAAMVAAVLAPAPMAVKTSSSMAVRNAAVCSKAFRVLKIRSGVGRPAVDGVAILDSSVGLLSAPILHSEIYCSNRRPAGILPHPRDRKMVHRRTAKIHRLQKAQAAVRSWLCHKD